MKAVSVRELKNNPSAALRAAREHPVMVLNRHQPEALLVHLDDEGLLTDSGVRKALATALYVTKAFRSDGRHASPVSAWPRSSNTYRRWASPS